MHDEQEEREAEREVGGVERQTAGESDERETTRKSSVAYAAGLTIFFSVLSFMGVGWVLDRWLDTSWIMVAGIVLGAVVGFYEFIRIISKIK
ncbi:MAG TPA: AtpZ/AtpI family protein [Pyrinomonadaceae bacterium]|nr:AtpZ/AtpI family protein [Pyrinomonadaceae bacterium]